MNEYERCPFPDLLHSNLSTRVQRHASLGRCDPEVTPELPLGVDVPLDVSRHRRFLPPTTPYVGGGPDVCPQLLFRGKHASLVRGQWGMTTEDAKERIDRELGELLEEVRIALPGAEVLFAFPARRRVHGTGD